MSSIDLPGMEPAGRFRIALMGGGFGPDHPAGLFVAQDGANAPYAQNFKLVSWVDVLRPIER